MAAGLFLKQLVFFMVVLLCLSASGNAGFGEVGEETRSPEGMVLIPAGELLQGSDSNQGYQICTKSHTHCKKSWFQDEKPAHKARLDEFYIDTHEVTQKQFQSVMGENPSDHKGLNLPVERVTWFEAAEYCKQAGKRLPTESEWEWAARGGKRSVFPWGDRAESGKANFCDRQCNKRWKENRLDDGYRFTAPVASFPANGYGVFDMAGNVYEWVADWYAADYYGQSPRDNPQGPDRGNRKVIRGGAWINYSTGIRPADRTEAKPGKRLNFTGFRCAL
jgi:formylglycine-generating enzyme required for sulfatase activity